jgi:hypothetical protein
VRLRGPSFYILSIGLVIGLVLVGLAVPFIFGESPNDVREVAALDDVEGDVGNDGAGVDAASAAGSAAAGGIESEGGEAAGTPGPGGVVPGAPVQEGSPSAPTGGPATSAVPTGAAQGAGTALRATDVGVTADSIKVGFLLLDTGGLSQIGIAVPGVDPVQQRAAFEAQLKDTNDRGGINGRKVVGVYEKFDVLSQDDMRRSCLAIRDQKPFAAVAAGGFQGHAVLCLTEEAGIPLVTQGSHGTPTDHLRRSKGRLVAMYPHSDRLMANWVAELDRQGVLKGKKIGIVAQDSVNPGNTVIGGGLIPALKRFGYTATHVSHFSADQSVAASQVPIEVQQMQTKEIDVVMLTTSTLVSTQFAQAADNQLFRPRYTITDWASMNNDTSNQNMPPSYDGTILITTYKTGEEKIGIGESAPERECRDIYERGTRRQLAKKGENEHGLTASSCTTLKAFLVGAAKAGPELTRAAFSRAVQTIGAFPMSMWGGGSFGPSKFDAADLVRTTKWQAGCRCLIPTDGFRKSRF